MRVIKVVPSKRYQHKLTGKQVSIYGAHPASSPNEYNDWEVVTVGWTWELDNGTIGLCRQPAKTEAEAIEIMNQFNNRLDVT